MAFAMSTDTTSLMTAQSLALGLFFWDCPSFLWSTAQGAHFSKRDLQHWSIWPQSTNPQCDGPSRCVRVYIWLLFCTVTFSVARVKVNLYCGGLQSDSLPMWLHQRVWGLFFWPWRFSSHIPAQLYGCCFCTNSHHNLLTSLVQITFFPLLRSQNN